ncbi:bacteriophage protein [Shigella sonnei]|nr:bacteriophage protein [Shigella sonnei]
MAKVFTQEEREKLKGRVVELVRLSGRETLRQLEAKTGATRYLLSVLARELVASGDVYNSDYGLFPSEQARKDWQNARKKLSRAKLKKKHLWLIRTLSGRYQTAKYVVTTDDRT